MRRAIRQLFRSVWNIRFFARATISGNVTNAAPSAISGRAHEPPALSRNINALTMRVRWR